MYFKLLKDKKKETIRKNLKTPCKNFKTPWKKKQQICRKMKIFSKMKNAVIETQISLSEYHIRHSWRNIHELEDRTEEVT